MPYKNKEKQREYQREWIANRRNEWFSDKYCVWCDSLDDLELHHLDLEEKENHRIWSWSWERISKEVSKCIVLCRECHIGYHAEYSKTPYEKCHGTSSGYYTHKCKCELCRDWKRRTD